MRYASSATIAQVFGWRREAAARAGLTGELERIRYGWTPSAGLPRSPGRLTFRPEPDDAAFMAVFRQVAAGSLDVTAIGRALATTPLTVRADLDPTLSSRE